MQESAGTHGDESEAQRLDRNLIELLNELRVSGTGIQVLLAFLLVVPFNQGYKRLDAFGKDLYFVALLCLAGAAVCLIAPSIHHRILFHHGQRPFIISLASRLAIAGMVLLAVGLLAILVLLSRVVFGDGAAATVGAAFAVLIGIVWFGIPLVRRWHSPRQAEPSR